MDLVFDIKEGFRHNIPQYSTCIIIGENDLTPNNKEMLLALLKAINLSEDTVTFYQFAKDQLLKLPKQASKIVLFGVDMERQLPNINSTRNEVCKLGAFTILNTNSLTELNNDVTLKANLWKALQEMFLKKESK